jgi:hypothetical protein
VHALLALAFMVVIAILWLKTAMQRYGPANTDDQDIIFHFQHSHDPK